MNNKALTPIRTMLGACVLALFGVVGCGADAAFDCASICDGYSDCLSNASVNIDVTTCTERCTDKATDTQANENAADACDDCLSANEDMCINCTAQCAPFLAIVATSTES